MLRVLFFILVFPSLCLAANGSDIGQISRMTNIISFVIPKRINISGDANKLLLSSNFKTNVSLSVQTDTYGEKKFIQQTQLSKTIELTTEIEQNSIYLISAE